MNVTVHVCFVVVVVVGPNVFKTQAKTSSFLRSRNFSFMITYV